MKCFEVPKTKSFTKGKVTKCGLPVGMLEKTVSNEVSGKKERNYQYKHGNYDPTWINFSIKGLMA